MADNNFSSANNDISVTAPAAGRGSPQAILSSMTKDVKKRWLMVGGLSAVAIAVIAATMSASGTIKPPPVKVDSVVDTTPKGLSSVTDWKTQTGAEIMALKQSLADSNATQKELLARMELMRKELAQVKEPGSSTIQSQTSRIDFSLPPPPEPPKSIKTDTTPMPGLATSKATTPTTTPESLFMPVAPIEPKRSAARAFFPTSGTDAASKKGDPTLDDMVVNERKGYLPAGSFADATLLSGVEAFTGGTAQSQPQPIVIRLDANAVLPNAALYQIKGCHVLASVWGDMSSERVFGRLATITCVDSNDKLVLSDEVEGSLVDSDGKNGVRGVLQDRQGAKLARSLLAGFAQGVSSAFGAAQSTTQTTALGTTTSVLTGDSFKAAGYNGASTAAQQLAQFYLKQAEATMPVIAIDAGRKVSVLFTKSKALKFESTAAYRVQPKEKLLVERGN